MRATYRPRITSLQGFMKWQPEDRFKYEWNKGKVEKTFNMKQLEFFIIKTLQRLFAQTNAYLNGHELITEGDVLTSADQLRRPDLAYYTNEQIMRAAKGENQIPSFIIEIVSPSDSQIQNISKVGEYFAAGVKVVWLVLPSVEQVHVYRSLKDVEICLENDSCSASPVLSDFVTKVESLFLTQKL